MREERNCNNEGNWLVWKTRIRTVLKRKDAFEIATGVTPQPQDPDDTAVWTQKDSLTQEIITLAIEDKQVLSVSECNTAAEMWESLCAIHEPCGQQSILSTKCALYSAQAKEGSDIASHLGYMKILRERLAMSGHRIDHMEFKSILVASLPHSWESFTSSFLGYQGGTQGNQQTQVMAVTISFLFHVFFLLSVIRRPYFSFTPSYQETDLYLLAFPDYSSPLLFPL